jgi:hypothetical protein
MIRFTTSSADERPVLCFRYESREKENARAKEEARKVLTRCQTRESVMRTSAAAEQESQMMTTTENFWKCTNSGTLGGGEGGKVSGGE